MRLNPAIIVCLSLLVTAQWVYAADEITIPIGFEEAPKKDGSLLPYYTISGPRLALALSGGGARGLAHIGVLQVFERNGIPIDGIAGTSMGAVIGGLYAAGYSAFELERIALQIKWSDLIQDRPARRQLFLGQKAQNARSLIEMRIVNWAPELRSSITGGHRFSTLLTDLLYDAPQSIHSDFDQLKIPLRIVATDLLTGQKVVFSGGSMVDAIRGSMAIPLLFTPVSYAPWYLVDGGLVQNLPVDEARLFHTDLVIAVDASSRLHSKEEMKAPWQIADQVTTIMHQHILESQMASADLTIQPDLSGVSNTDFDQIARIIDAGRIAAEETVRTIEDRIHDIENPFNRETYIILSIDFSGLDQVNREQLIEYIDLDLSNPVSVEEMVWTGQVLYQTGYFQKISASLDTNEHTLTFHCLENPVIDQIDFEGNLYLSDEEILSQIKLTPGVIMSQSCSRDCYSAIVKYYREKGYSLFRILDTKISGRKMTIQVDEGRISQIKFTGNHRTHASVIERDLSIKKGDLFNIHEMTASLENLYSTGLFDDIRFDIQEEAQKRTLVLIFIEKPFHLVRFGLRYDLERQTKGFIEFSEENVLGLGGSGSVTALYGSWDQKGQIQIRTDRLFNSLWTAEASAGIEKNRFRYFFDYEPVSVYTLYRNYASLALGQQMQKLGTLWAQINTEAYKTSHYEGGYSPQENTVLTTLNLRSVVDTRDAVPFPSSGKYYILEYQSSLAFLGSREPFFKIYSSMSSYYALTNRIVFMPRLRWGTADLTVPFIKQFRIGGMDSFCGLPEGGAIGKRFITLNTMLRYQIPWISWFRQYFSIRYDFGGIWERYSKIALSDFIHGAGLIWSAKTPAGPVYLGWARLSTGHSRWYFSMGYDFE